MAKQVKKKVRTKAERSAAARAAWKRRQVVETPPTQTFPIEVKFSGGESNVQTRSLDTLLSFPVTITTASVTKEGESHYVNFYTDGSHIRQKLSSATLRQLGLDALQLVG